MNLDYIGMIISSITIIGLLITIAVFLFGEDPDAGRKDDKGL